MQPGPFASLKTLVCVIAAAFFASVTGASPLGARDQVPLAFNNEVKPLVTKYCLRCHSAEKHKGDIDLEQFVSGADLFKHPETWERVLEQLSNGDMPPADKPQPTAEEHQHLLSGVNSILDGLAQAGAGDPGPVVLRRLNNAEYTFTIRDLTGIASLDPAKELPGDSASGEGFMNVGNSLVISPSLLTKYLDAAKEIAKHAVLLPDGIAFSAGVSQRDWTDEKLAVIRNFYARFTENGAGTSVNLQGIKFDTKDGGVLPLEKYFAAMLSERDGIQAGNKSIESVATEHGLNAKYLGILWNAINDATRSLLLDEVRAQWRKASPADVAPLVATVRRWQKALWLFTSVGHIGKRDGPKAWQVPVSPLAAAREVHFKIPPTTNNEVTIYLVTSDAGDGTEHDFAVWENPRFIGSNRPNLLLRDVRAATNTVESAGAKWGVDPSEFGPHSGTGKIADNDLGVQAPSVIPIRLPAKLVEGCEFVATATLQRDMGAEGSVQMQVLTSEPSELGLVAGDVHENGAKKTWSDGQLPAISDSPVLALEGSAARRRIEAAFDDFRQLFPAALCYTKIVPVDEVVTLTLFYREDDQLRRLMLDDSQSAELDRLWAELHYISQDALKLVDAFDQLWQFATQDADPKAFEPLREPIKKHAAEFRTLLENSQPVHLDAVLKFAEGAYRRPLTPDEQRQARILYRQLRDQEISHDQAIRLMLTRVLTAPAFLYRAEAAAPGNRPGPVSNWELATRLSYFLWSTCPDAPLRAVAAAGELSNNFKLTGEARRMLRDARVRRFASEFAAAWFQIHDFETLDEKSERHFPTFASLRGPMYEEALRFFTDLFQNDGSVLSLIDADYTFLNGPLAEHYGVPGVTGPEWRRVDGVKKYGRGGVLGLGAVLAKESGASRTSPILRGNWVAEVLLGDRLPRPPKDVPRLPEDESGETLSVRQLVEKHDADPRCAGCHVHIDGYGFVLEGFDAIGRMRSRDLAGHPIETRAKVFDGTTIEDAKGLRDYLLNHKRDAFLAQFSRKLLGYALGRAVILSDRPLLIEMQHQLELHNFRFSAAVETIVNSPQFREIRGEGPVGQ